VSGGTGEWVNGKEKKTEGGREKSKMDQQSEMKRGQKSARVNEKKLEPKRHMKKIHNAGKDDLSCGQKETKKKRAKKIPGGGTPSHHST